MVLGVISRDYDFDQHAPEDEMAGRITAENFAETTSILHNLLERELRTPHQGALNRSYFCQLLRCTFRVHYHSISTLSPSFLTTFASVSLLRSLHFRPLARPPPMWL